VSRIDDDNEWLLVWFQDQERAVEGRRRPESPPRTISSRFASLSHFDHVPLREAIPRRHPVLVAEDRRANARNIPYRDDLRLACPDEWSEVP
jgi:hypothetical protein